MTWLIGGAIYFAFLCFAWALCIAAARADNKTERMMKREDRHGHNRD